MLLLNLTCSAAMQPCKRLCFSQSQSSMKETAWQQLSMRSAMTPHAKWQTCSSALTMPMPHCKAIRSVASSLFQHLGDGLQFHSTSFCSLLPAACARSIHHQLLQPFVYVTAKSFISCTSQPSPLSAACHSQVLCQLYVTFEGFCQVYVIPKSVSAICHA